MYSGSGVETVEAGHVDIHDGDVYGVRDCCIEDLVAAGYRRDNIDVGFEVQQCREGITQDSNILGE